MKTQLLSFASALSFFSLVLSVSAAPPWAPDCAECATTLTIGGQPMHIEKSGNRGPIVVFVSGLGADSSAWRAVAGPISDFAQVVRYDRAGLGLSKPLTAPGRPITARGLHEHSRALLHRLSRRHRRPRRSGANGFQHMVRGLSRRQMVYVRRPTQPSEDRPDRNGARP